MRKIYYKEGEKVNNKHNYIIGYLKLATPTTYYVDTGFIQCRPGKARTFNDLLWLLQSKFSTATKGDLARILLHKDNIETVGCIACPDVKQMTFYDRRHKVYGNYALINRYSRHGVIKKGPQWADLVKWATRKKDFELRQEYILKDENENVKEFRKLFIKFLKEKGVYKKFLNNLKIHNHSKTISAFVNYNPRVARWVISAFVWSETTDNIDWSELNDKWHTVVSRINQGEQDINDLF